MVQRDGIGLERKFCALDQEFDLKSGCRIGGYASLFGKADQGGDIVQKGAYAASLKAMSKAGRKVKMLWQHDPTQPIGVWDEVREDTKGLWVEGRILPDLRVGAEALALLKAGAIEGLSIGYRTIRATKASEGRRLLHELDLWEVSLVTFPMLPEARVEAEAKADDHLAQALAEAIRAARQQLLA